MLSEQILIPAFFLKFAPVSLFPAARFFTVGKSSGYKDDFASGL